MSLVDAASVLELRLINPAKNACPIDRGTMCRWVEDAGAICRATVVLTEAQRRPVGLGRVR
jgi:hypothetical protein